MDYQKEAEKLVTACELLEEEYADVFMELKSKKDKGEPFEKEMEKCHQLASALERIDLNNQIQSGFTFFPSRTIQFGKRIPKQRERYFEMSRKRFVKKAIELLKQGKLKPLK